MNIYNHDAHHLRSRQLEAFKRQQNKSYRIVWIFCHLHILQHDFDPVDDLDIHTKFIRNLPLDKK